MVNFLYPIYIQRRLPPPIVLLCSRVQPS